MAKADQILIQFRMDKKTRDEAGKILKSMGTDVPTYLRMAIRRVILEQGIPFSTTLPGEEITGPAEFPKLATKTTESTEATELSKPAKAQSAESPKPVAVKEESAKSSETVAVKTGPKEPQPAQPAPSPQTAQPAQPTQPAQPPKSPQSPTDEELKETIAKIRAELHATEMAELKARRAKLEAFKAEQEAERAKKLATPKSAPRPSANEPILFDKINVEIAEARAEMDAEIERQKEEAELKKLLWEKRKLEIRKSTKLDGAA